MQNKLKKTKNFCLCAVRYGAYSNSRSLKYYLHYMFEGVPLAKTTLLDVGGGSGLLSLWAALNGSKVICLEPESNGSTSEVSKIFKNIKNCIDKKLNAKLKDQPLLSFLNQTKSKFNIVVMANSINHLDENACIRLNKEMKYKKTYLKILKSIFDAMYPGGYLIITDCSKSNFFNDVGIRSPFMKTIQWEKHQDPLTWNNLLNQVGFETNSPQWSTPNVFGNLGRKILGNRFWAYFLFSHFRLVARKPNKHNIK